jgi:hypothetical protein
MAVSEDNRERLVIKVMPPIMNAAPMAAPIIPENPARIDTAMPGKTPWASASPMKANPRKITKVPAIAQAIETKTPAISAWDMKALDENGVTNKSILILF